MKALQALPLIFLTTAALEAASLSVTDVFNTPNGGVYNLDTYGGLDWSVWKKPNGTDPAYNLATNTRASSSAISDLFLVGTTTTAGYRASTSSPPTWDFSFTGGTSPPATTLTDVNGVFHPDIGATGKGVGLTVTLPTTDVYRITLFVAGYDTTSTLTASLPGLTPVTNSTFTPGLPDAGVKRTGYFTIDAGADVAGQALTLEFVNTSNNSSSHVMIAAVAVQLIPEPSTPLAASVFFSLGLLRRRRAALPR